MPVQGGVKAGKISKPYGLHGEVNVILDPETGKQIETDRPLFINIDGQRVPFLVEEFDQVSSDQAIVKFEFIDNVEQARAVSGCEIYYDLLKRPAAQQGQNDYSELIGYRAIDRKMGYLGMIVDFMQHDINPLFMIDYEGKELLIPAADELIEQINHKEQSIHFLLPEGLTTL